MTTRVAFVVRCDGLFIESVLPQPAPYNHRRTPSVQRACFRVATANYNTRNQEHETQRRLSTEVYRCASSTEIYYTGSCEVKHKSIPTIIQTELRRRCKSFSYLLHSCSFFLDNNRGRALRQVSFVWNVYSVSVILV